MSKLFRDRYRISSTRLPHWDYTNAGWYFVTICTKDRLPHFGEVVDGEMQLSPIGEIAAAYWREIPVHHNNVAIDVSVVMPNHLHGIVTVGAAAPPQDVACNVSTKTGGMSRISPEGGSLSVVIRSFKSAVTRRARAGGYRDFAWQPRFYDHVIRNDASLDEIRQYIVNNPAKWDLDRDNPANLRM